MNEVLQYPGEFLQETGHVPSVCLVLPFEPQLHDKHTILGRLKVLLARAEGRLFQYYTTTKALPVLTSLQQLIAGINFSNYKKSIALLASPYGAHLYYLDFPVTECVRTGEDIDIRDVIKARRKEISYLALVLDDLTATLYSGVAQQLTCIKINQHTDGTSRAYDPSFFIKLDQGLGLVLQAYPLPVFVLGPERALDKFKQLTVHADSILCYVPGHFDAADVPGILNSLQPELDHWSEHKQRFLLRKLERVNQEGKLSCGIQAVWATATHHRSRLLVVEANLTSLSLQEGKGNTFTVAPAPADPYHTKDLVDDIIEKVLRDGGDVEFVAPGILAAYQQIALIEFHQSQ